MDFQTGTRLGPYEIRSLIGSGGMGQVYLATDSRLGRTVAIKVLSDRVADRRGLRERFEREARAVSGLSHPHICTLHDVGSHEGTDFLVMEYLEGESLADRLARGKLSTDETLAYAVQIANALDHAHRRGVVHRDLKPGNIMLIKSGAKVLDFGLAKLHSSQPDAPATSDSPLPTKTHPLTAEGTIVGTLQYMAPEQLEGRATDSRSDIFAFGAVLYEMATGQRAFAGKSKASVIAAILQRNPPPMSQAEPMTPPALERLVETCLQKDPDDRWQTARDLARELSWIADGGGHPEAAATTAAPRRGRELLAWFAAATCLVAVIALAVVHFRDVPAEEAQPVRFVIPPPPQAKLSFVIQGSGTKISPDGRLLAFIASVDGRKSLWVRPLSTLEAKPLSGTRGASSLFWSPDSRYLGFFAEGKLKKIPADGGPIETLCEAHGRRASGTWGRDGTILFGVVGGIDKIYRVAATGGTPVLVVGRDKEGPRVEDYWPYFLPDGRRFLWLAWDFETGRYFVHAGSLDSTDTKRIIQADSWAAYASPGYLLYAREGVLLAHPFDAEALRVTGNPSPVVEQVAYHTPTGTAHFSVSNNGVLVYRTAFGVSQLKWRDRAGRDIGLVGEPRDYEQIRLSPDARRVVTSVMNLRAGGSDIWIYDLERNVPTRFTSEYGGEFAPIWSADGKRIIFTADRNGPPHLHQKALSGDAREEELHPPGPFQKPWDCTSDDRYLVYEDVDSVTHSDIWLLPLFGDREPIPLLRTRFNELGARFSPDDGWLVFASDESGTPEVYVQRVTIPADRETGSPRLLESSERYRISRAGGRWPVWHGEDDQIELFYIDGNNQLVSVPVTLEPAFKIGEPETLFPLGPDSAPSYDVSPDGQRFIVVSPLPGADDAAITVDLNWTARLPQQ